jgi:hypothetical protein
MQALGFDNYAGVMKVYLSKYRVVCLFSLYILLSIAFHHGETETGLTKKHQANLLGNQDEDDGDEDLGTGKKKKRKDAKKRKRESGGDEPGV